jgi:hypothetical protein
MPAYNFKAKFAEAVENGFRQASGQPVPEGAEIKRQTVRMKRKRPTRPGDTIYGYAGMRTKGCRKLGEAPAIDVEPVDIHPGYVLPHVGSIRVGGRILDPDERLQFVQADGFADEREFFRFFEQTYGLPLVSKMEVIRW